MLVDETKDPMSYKVEIMVKKYYFESEEQKVFKRVPPGADMHHGKEGSTVLIV